MFQQQPLVEAGKDKDITESSSYTNTDLQFGKRRVGVKRPVAKLVDNHYTVLSLALMGQP